MEFILKFKNYLLSLKPSPSKVTVKNYVADVKHFVFWYEKAFSKTFDPKSISLVTIEQFRKEKGTDLSASSLDRHISSLRKFFQALKMQSIISSSPFELPQSPKKPEDTYHLKEFKDFLYVYNASRLTIKNYLIDVKQFLSWAETVTQAKESWNVADKNVFTHINDALVAEYRERLLSENVFSPSSINRKLSSLRKYLSWAHGKGLLQQIAIPGSLNATAKIASTQSPSLTESNINLDKSQSDQLRNKVTQDEQSQKNRREPTYSRIPPVRLFQKLGQGLNIGLEALFVTPLTALTLSTHKAIWRLKGKPLFVKSLHENFLKPEAFKPGFSNIPKAIYNPVAISIKHFPWHKKAWFHVRFTRPNWYRRYHSLAIAHYFNWAILIIFATAVGFGMYTSFVKKSTPSLAAVPTAPLRILSFQGRLTDSSDNPITSATWLRFAIYNTTSSSGSAQLWEEVRQVSPDQDGIFSVLLGSNGSGGAASSCGTFPLASPATGACGIPSTLFNNNALWLGVTVNATPELTPRQQLATVAFAANSETLQGLHPITESGAGTQNVVLALDSSGNLSIGASTQFQSTTGQFSLLGNSLLLGTNAGTNGNVALSPDGTGTIDLQKPLQNTTLNNNIPSAAGAVEVDDLFAVLATSSGQSAVTINQNGTGPLISASVSGSQRFTLDNGGNGTFNGSVTGSTLYVGNGTTYYTGATTSNLNALTLNGNLTMAGSAAVASNLDPSANNTYSLGSSGGNEWLNLYAQNIYSNGQLISQLWQRTAGVVAPINITDDLAVGGTATSTAKFQVFGNSGNATTSGNLTFNGNGTIQTTNNQPLTIGGSTTGGIILNPNNGTGIVSVNASALQTNASTFNLLTSNATSLSFGTTGGTTTVNSALTVTGNITPNGQFAASLIPTGNSINLGSVANNFGTVYATNVVLPSSGGIGGYWQLNSGVLSPTNITNDLTVGGTATSTAKFQVFANSGTQPVVAVNGNTSYATASINNSGTGDLLTASASGTPEFIVTNAGVVKARSFYDLDNTSYFLDPAATTSLIIAGTEGIGTTAPLSQSALDIEKNGLGNAVFVANQKGSGDILSASASGATKFTVGNNGSILSADYTTAGGILFTDATGLFTQTTAGTTGQCLQSNAGATPTWGACGSGGGSFWTLDTTHGDMYPINTTLDIFAGGTSTASAKFAVLNMTGSGTPTASVSAVGSNTALVLKGDGSIQSVNETPLTIGGGQTGSVIINSGNITQLADPTTQFTNGSPVITTTGNTPLTIGAAGTGVLNFFNTNSFINSSGALTLASNLTVKGTTATFGNGSDAILQTLSNANLQLFPGGNGNVVLGQNSGVGNVIIQPNAGGQAALIVNKQGDNDILTASASGSTKLTLDHTGNLLPGADGAQNLGSNTLEWNVVYAKSFVSPVGNGTSGFWTVTNNTNLYPSNSADDLLVGGTATGSATFQIFAQSVGSIVGGTASTSGNLTLNSNATIATTKFNGLNIGGATTGNITISAQNASGTINLNAASIDDTTNSSSLFATPTILTFAGGATTLNIGAGTGTTTIKNNLSINGTFQPNGQLITNLIPSSTSINLGSASNFYGQVYANNLNLPSSGGIGGYWQLNSGALSPTNIANDVLVGGIATSSAKFQIFANSGNATTSGNLTFNATGSLIQTTNNQALTIGGSSTGNITLLPLNGGTGSTINANAAIIATNQTSVNLLNTTATTLNFAGAATTLNLANNALNTTIGIGGTSGTTTVNNALTITGALTVNNNAVLGATSSNTITANGLFTSSLIPNAPDTYSLGSPAKEWDTLYVRQIVTPVTGGTAGYWQLSSLGVLSPANLTNDLAVGGTSTASAVFQVFASGTNAGTATTSGNLVFRGTSSKVNILNGSDLTFQGSVGGDAGLSTANQFIIKNNGSASTSANLTFTGLGNSNAAKINLLNNTTLGFYNSVGGDTGVGANPALFLAANGNVGLGTSSPTTTLDVVGSASLSANLAFRGGGAQTISLLNNSSLGFYPSVGGSAGLSANPALFIANQGSLGHVGIGTTTPQGILDVASSGPTFPSDLTLAQATTTNLVPNPSFENTSGYSTSWAISNSAQFSQNNATESALFGSKALRFYNVTPSGTYTTTTSCIAVTSGSTYTASAYIYRVSGFSGNTGIDVQTFTNGTCSAGQATAGRVNTTSTNQWTRVTTTVPTTGISSVEVRFITDGTNTNSRAYADGFQLEQAAFASNYADGSLGPGYSWTGTPNNSSSVRQANSAFAYDSFNSANGLGAASNGTFPTLQLDQQGTGDLIAASSSGNLQFKVSNTGVITAHSFYDLDNTAYYLDPAASGTSLTVAGNVGIGTTSPINVLQVTNAGGAGILGSFAAESGTGTELTTGSTVPIVANGSGTEIGIINAENREAFAINIDGDGGTTGSRGYVDLFDKTNGTWHQDIALNNGNVGIGTTGPGYKLEVAGDVYANGGWLRVSGNQGVYWESYAGEFFMQDSTWIRTNNNSIWLGSGNYGSNGGLTLGYGGTTPPSGGIIASGNVGIGTSGPGGELDIQQNCSCDNIRMTNHSRQWAMGPGTGTGSGPFGIYDITGARLDFLIDTNGNVGIGTSGPGSTLELHGQNGAGQLRLTSTGTSAHWDIGPDNSSNNIVVYSSGGGGMYMLNANQFWSARSDERLKTNIVPLSYSDPLGAIMKLNPVSFNWRNASQSGFTNLGFIAQQVQQVFPELVSTGSDTTITLADGSTETIHNPLGVEYDGLISPAIAAIQELSLSVSAQQSQVASNSAILANMNLTTTGDIAIAPASPSADFIVPTYYSLSDVLGNPITRMGTFLELAVGNLRAGSVQAQQTITNTLAVTTGNVSIAGQSLHDYIAGIVNQVLAGQTTPLSPIAEVNQLHTNLISPLASSSAIALDLSNNSRIDVKNTFSQQTVASIDNNGNATFSGQLNAQNLAVNGDATVSGTLYANNIKANSIEGLQEVVGTLSAQNITNVTNIYFATPSGEAVNANSATGSTAPSSTNSGVLASPVILSDNEGSSPDSSPSAQNDNLNFASTFSQSNFTSVASYSAFLAYVPNLSAQTGMFDQGLVSLGSTSLSDTTIAGQLAIGSQLILANNSVNVLGTDFQIQPLRQGGVSFEGGLIAINTNGDLTVNGKAIFNNTVLANVISPLSNTKDLTIQLGQNNPATGSALATATLNVQNASGSGIFNIDQLGNVVASGAATIGKLNFALVQPALAVSDTEVVATGSAGTAVVKAHQTEITIDNTSVTSKSLIYITPVGNSGVIPYLTRQIPAASFTVGIPAPLPTDTTFNWLIVN